MTEKILTLKNFFLDIRVRYNYAHYLQTKGQNLEAIQIAIETIDFCKKHETTHQLASLLMIVVMVAKIF